MIVSYVKTLLSRASEKIREWDTPDQPEQEQTPTNFCKNCRFYDDTNQMRRLCRHDLSFRGVDVETGEKQYRLACSMRDDGLDYYADGGACGYMGVLFEPKEPLPANDGDKITSDAPF